MKILSIGDNVWKSGAASGYEGPGRVVASFRNWMGQPRYVVAHKIQNGKGFFYHIYSEREIARDDRPKEPVNEG